MINLIDIHIHSLKIIEIGKSFKEINLNIMIILKKYIVF